MSYYDTCTFHLIESIRDFFLGDIVQGRGRFIKNENLWLGSNGAGNHKALPLAAGNTAAALLKDRMHTHGHVPDVISNTGNDVCRLIGEATAKTLALYKTLGLGEIMCMHDSCPVLYLAHPEFFSGKECCVRVETGGEHGLGKTVSDLYSDAKLGDKNTLAMLKVDREAVVKLVTDIYRSY